MSDYTWPPHTPSTGVTPRARRCLADLRDAVRWLPAADQAWWEDQCHDLHFDLGATPPGVALPDAAATVAAALAVEGARWVRDADEHRSAVGSRAVLLGVACGVVRVMR